MQTQEQNPNDTMNATERKFWPDKCAGIYGLRNKETNKWYVGFSTDIGRRWRTYKRLACVKQPKLFEALNLYGFDGFELVVLEICSVDSLKCREIYWIKEKNSIASGYNINESGTLVTKEMIEKISKSLKGRKYSIEHRQKMSLAHKGIPRTDETKKNISVARTGVSTITEEGRRKIREANSRRGQPNLFQSH